MCRDCGCTELNGCGRLFPARVSGGYSSVRFGLAGAGDAGRLGRLIGSRAFRSLHPASRKSHDGDHHMALDRDCHCVLGNQADSLASDAVVGQCGGVPLIQFTSPQPLNRSLAHSPASSPGPASISSVVPSPPLIASPSVPPSSEWLPGISTERVAGIAACPKSRRSPACRTSTPSLRYDPPRL